MNILTDIHCHTVASTHAYSTVKELAESAAARGMEAIAVTDHAPEIPDAPHLWHFENLWAIPREIAGVKILYGAEVNIIDDKGTIDMPLHLLKKLDIIVASIHEPCFYGTKGRANYADTYTAVLDNPYVDVIGHSGTPDYPYACDDVLLKAKSEHKLIEINAHTFVARRKSIDNCRMIAQRCKDLAVGIAVNSDAHICFDVGEYTPALEMLREIGFPETLIMNRNFDVLKRYFAERKTIHG